MADKDLTKVGVFSELIRFVEWVLLYKKPDGYVCKEAKDVNWHAKGGKDA